MKFKTIISIIFIAFCICIIIVFLFFHQNSEIPRAIIVDNLALDGESESGADITFVKEAEKILESTGVEVDYVDVNDVTLEVYQNLARYHLIILRVHSGVLKNDGAICFFSSEKLTKQKLQKYGEWFSKGYLANATLEYAESSFIGLKPDFIRNCLNGEFHNSTVIAMGCNSSINDSMARAFVDRKALVYIGWTRDVTVNHTDSATLELLKNFFEKNETIKEAVEKAPADPKTGAKLTYYPHETTANLRPKRIIEELLKMKSSFISVVKIFPRVLLAILLTLSQLGSVIENRRFFRKF